MATTNDAAAPVDVLAVMDERISFAEKGIADFRVAELREARAAVAELIEAAGLRVEWVNGTWYVTLADGKTALSSRGHATESAAHAERDEALRAAMARVGGA